MNPNGESGTCAAAEDPRLLGSKPSGLGARLLSASGAEWFSAG